LRESIHSILLCNQRRRPINETAFDATSTAKRPRIAHIDIAKGISIVLVVVVHSNIKFYLPGLVEFLFFVRLPLFFFLSGIFFSALITPGRFVIKKFEALLKPYFIVLLLVMAIDTLFDNPHNHWGLGGIFYGNFDTIKWPPMWFLTHLFAVFCLAYLLFRVVRFGQLHAALQCAVLLLAILLGTLLMDHFWLRPYLAPFGYHHPLPGLPFSLDLLPVSTAFFVAGHLLKNAVIGFKPRMGLIILALIVYLVIERLTQAQIDLNRRIYDYPLLSTLGAACGIYIALSLSYGLTKIPTLRRLFLALGGSSLYILIFHNHIEHLGWDWYRSLEIGPTITGINFLITASIFALSVALPLLVKWLAHHNSLIGLIFLPIRNHPYFQRATQKTQHP
jgi:polysaccharide biosynthesis protein PslL